MMIPLDLTIAIPVKNEEKNLPTCLAAIGKDLARHIVLIDSNSTDCTQAIAHEYGIDVINFDWNGMFPKKRNWYLRNHTPQTKWVMFLDADEFITEKFKIELRSALSKGDSVGYWLRYNIYFMGKPLKGGYFLKKLALFQVNAGEYERIDENSWSKLDMEVHEHPVLNGKIGNIKSKIDHQDFRGISYYVTKHNEYSNWEASRFFKMSKNTGNSSRWSRMQRIKYSMMRSPALGVAFFFGSYFLMGGFRDGARGLAFAILKMAYFIQVYCKIREIEKVEPRPELSPIVEPIQT